MPRLETPNELTVKLLKAAESGLEVLIETTATWLLQELADPTHAECRRKSLEARSLWLNRHLGTPKIEEEPSVQSLTDWVRETCHATHYPERLKETKEIQHDLSTRSGKAPGTFWPFPGIRQKTRDRLQQAHPIDFIPVADDPRLWPATRDKTPRTNQRLVRQRRIAQHLYVGYTCPIDWAWQKAATTQTTPAGEIPPEEGQFGSLSYTLHPAKLTILAELQQLEATRKRKVDPTQEAQIIKNWGLTKLEFREWEPLAGTKIGQAFYSFTPTLSLPKFLIQKNYEDLKEIPVAKELKIQFEKAEEDNLWETPPDANTIFKLLQDPDIEEIHGGLSYALSPNAQKTLQLSGDWIALTQSRKPSERRLAMHAFLLAWSCEKSQGSKASRRQELAAYCAKHNLPNPENLGWEKLNLWVEIARGCEKHSKFEERATHGIPAEMKIAKDVLPWKDPLRYYCTREFQKELGGYLSKRKHTFCSEPSPLEAWAPRIETNQLAFIFFMSTEYNSELEEVRLDKENEICRRFNLTAQDAEDAMLNPASQTLNLQLGIHRGRDTIYPKNTSLKTLLDIVRKNRANQKQIRRLRNIANLQNPSPFLLKIHEWGEVIIQNLRTIKAHKTDEIGYPFLSSSTGRAMSIENPKDIVNLCKSHLGIDTDDPKVQECQKMWSMAPEAQEEANRLLRIQRERLDATLSGKALPKASYLNELLEKVERAIPQRGTKPNVFEWIN